MLQTLNERPKSRFSLGSVPAVLWVVLGLIALFAVATGGRSIRVSNLMNVAAQGSVLLILSLGATLAILTEGIDLSLGSQLSLSGVVAALMIQLGVPPFWAMLIGVGVGVVVGAINGSLISVGKLPPFIATFSMLCVAGGLAVVLVSDRARLPLDTPLFKAIGRSHLGVVPMPVIVAAVCYVVVHVLLYYTRFGHYVFALGGNEEGAALSGVNTVFWKVMVYVVAGTLASIAGVLLAARLSSADSIVGVGWEFDAIAVTIVGGTSFQMGKGGIRGTVLGAAMIALLRNGLNVVGIWGAYQVVVIGLVTIGAIVIDVALERRRKWHR